MKEGIPENIKGVIRRALQGDTEAIRHHKAASRKGGLVSAENKRLEKEELKRTQMSHMVEMMLERARVETISPDGDVLPPDEHTISMLEERLRELR